MSAAPSLNSDITMPVQHHKRARTPTLLQMEAAECGAAALGSILGYYGRFVPLEELRLACGVSRNGSRANNVVHAARTYGLVAKGFKYELEDLRSLHLPVILFWNFSHFVVLEGFGKRKVYLNDPATGPRTVTDDDFDRAFTGVVLTFEPGPEFKKGGAQRSVYGSLLRRLAGASWAIAFAILASVGLVLLQLAVPAFMRLFIDDYLTSGQSSIVGPLLGAMALTAALMGAFTLLQQRALVRLETKMALSQSSKFLWHLLRLPIVFFTQRSPGDLGNRVAINDTVAKLLSGDLATNVLGVGLILLYVSLMVRYDVLLTLIAVGFAALNLVVLRYVSRLRRDQNQRLLSHRFALIGTASNGLRTIESLKASGTESDFFARWAGQQARVTNAEQNLGISTQVLSVMPPLLAALNTAFILLVGGLRIIDGGLTIGTLVAFQVLVASFMAPVTGLVNLGSEIQEAEGGMNRLDDVHRYPEDPLVVQVPTKLETEAPPRLAGHIELRDVSFGYSRLEPALIEHFDLVLKPGSRVALVGASGSGKSTIARLVSGLYEPWEGQILFDGHTQREIPRPLIAASLGVASQEISLFEGSIKDNITMWDASIPYANVVQAAKDAAIHEDISTRPGGYGHVLEEDGRNFSGGQRQRMEIARALAANPSILILDEATSALDPVTEQLIDDQIRRRGCTCLIVAHRLSTIRDCDEIIVLERGKVVQRGTHDQMKRGDGPYAVLMKADTTSKKRSYLDAL